MADVRDKLNIIDFCQDPDLMNMPLLDTQIVLLKLAYGIPMTQAEIDLWLWMIEDSDYLDTRSIGEKDSLRWERPEWQEIVWILGGRSSKTTLAALIASYESTTRDWSRYIRRGELAWFFVLATKEQQAIDLGRSMIFSNIQQSKYLSQLIVDDSSVARYQHMFPRSRAGVLVLSTGCAITALPCSARVGRGYPICGCIFDEVAWFKRESKNQATDIGIYTSITPRMLQFGEAAKTVLISTPADKKGLLWEKWRDRSKNKKLYFIVKLPTWKMRTDYEKKFFERQRKLSPLTYEQEFAAEFTDSLAPLIRMVDIEPNLRESEEAVPPHPETIYVMAIDAAFGDNDRFAIAVGHVEFEGKPEDLNETTPYQILIDVAEFVTETFEKELVEAAADRTAELFQKYDILEVHSDDYQSDAFGKLLEQRGVSLKPEAWTAKKHRSCYGRLISLLKQRRISLPRNEDLVEEIAGLQRKFLPSSGQYTVVHRPGGHDDLADAVVEVVYRLTEDHLYGPAGMQVF